jgi:hypothetical protein
LIEEFRAERSIERVFLASNFASCFGEIEKVVCSASMKLAFLKRRRIKGEGGGRSRREFVFARFEKRAEMYFRHKNLS